MAVTYPCQTGLPSDLDPSFKGIIFLCCDFRIISQEHDGMTCAETYADETSMKWVAVSDRGSNRMKIVITEDPYWLEFQIRLSTNSGSSDFLRIIFRQKRETSKMVHHLGWNFSGSSETDGQLRMWLKMVWPTLYRESIEVDDLRKLIPRPERDLASSGFMLSRISDIFGWFSQIR